METLVHEHIFGSKTVLDCHDANDISFFQQTIMSWYGRHKRDLPWRKTQDPYAILVSEIMSQQTQVARVIPKWDQWMKDFPTIEVLAQASLEDVLQHRSGLGYNRRGKALWDAAKHIWHDSACEAGTEQQVCAHAMSFYQDASCLGGKTQSGISELGVSETWKSDVGSSYPGSLRPEIMKSYLLSLPGIGEYTASAVCAFAWNMAIPVLDINITRVFRFVFGHSLETYSSHKDPSVIQLMKSRENNLYALAKDCIPIGQSRDWHNALMDYGALVLHSKKTGIRSASQSTFVGSDREVRGWIMKQLAAGIQLHIEDVAIRFPEKKQYRDIVIRLAKDGLISVQGERIVVAR